jgi:hypothetical protein
VISLSNVILILKENGLIEYFGAKKTGKYMVVDTATP